MLRSRRLATFVLMLVLSAAPVAASAATSCLPSLPLPTAPTPPVYSTDLTFFSDRTRIEVWRQSCSGGGTAVLLRATPQTVAPFFCSTQFSVVQSGSQFSTVFLERTPGSGVGFCAGLLVAQTFFLNALAQPAPFDPTLAFTLAYRGGSNGSTVTTLQVPAAGSALPAALAGAAVLPGSRSVRVGTAATAFATLIAGTGNAATGCSIAPQTSVAANFSYQTTDPQTNAPTGSPNTPVDIPGGAAQSFVISFTPTAAFATTDVRLTFDCTNTDPVAPIPGVNTLLLAASAVGSPDVIALAATASGDGVVNILGNNGAGAFAVATVNVGTTGAISVVPDTGTATLPVTLTVCQTNSTTGACIAAPAASVTTQIASSATPTFAVFIRANGAVPFNPATNRVFLRLREFPTNEVRGATSVAIRTQ